MTFWVTLLALALSACQSLSPSKLTSLKPDPSHLVYLVNCMIYDTKFELVRALPGDLCWPLDDGSWLSIDEREVVKRGANGQILWKINGRYHHRVRTDGEFTIAMTSDTRVYRGKRVVFDKIQKIDAKGKVVREFPFIKNVQRLNELRPPEPMFTLWTIPRMLDGKMSIAIDFSHTNSVQVLDSRWAPSRYLIGDPILGACLALDEDLQLTGLKFDVAKKAQEYAAVFHDCQLIADGGYLYFQNNYKTAGLETYRIHHLGADKKTKFTFPTQAQDYRRSPFKGNVQWLGDRYLFSVADEKETFVGTVSPSGQWLNKRVVPGSFQEVFLLDLRSFLEKNQVH